LAESLEDTDGLLIKTHNLVLFQSPPSVLHVFKEVHEKFLREQEDD
jgi:hypothetical protein